VTNEAEVYFALYGADPDPDEVTQIVGMEPTAITRLAHPRPKQTKWKVSSGKMVNDVIDVYEMSARLVTRLAPFTDKLPLAKRQLNAEAVLEVVLWITTERRFIIRHNAFLKQLAESRDWSRYVQLA
jgi:hypothetical protein